MVHPEKGKMHPVRFHRKHSFHPVWDRNKMKKIGEIKMLLSFDEHNLHAVQTKPTKKVNRVNSL